MSRNRNRNLQKEIKDHPLTNQRRLLLELLRDAGSHIDAKELYRQAINRDSSISLATIYRSLILFKRLGLVEERRLSESRRYYEIRQTAEHQHLICRQCGKVIEFQSPVLEKVVKSILHDNGFNISQASLYLEGNCDGCDESRKPPVKAEKRFKSINSNLSN
jgi:Fur family ferric uptake transcriptional regulator